MKIKQLRLSCIWTYNTLNMLAENDGPYSCNNRFKQMQEEGKWRVPWEESSKTSWEEDLQKSFFWKCYLELNQKDKTNFNIKNDKDRDAFLKKLTTKSHEKSNHGRILTHLVPLKYKEEIKIKKGKHPIKFIKFEIFFYPCAISVIATIYMKLNTSVEESVKLTQKLMSVKYNTELIEDNAKIKGNIDELAKQLIEKIHQRYFNESIGELKKPFTVVTIVDAEREQENNYELPDDNRDFTFLKRGLCIWDKNFMISGKYVYFPEEEFQRDANNKAVRMIKAEKARLIWYPSYFSENLQQCKEKYYRRLGRYHRHLTLLALQKEMLESVKKAKISERSSFQYYLIKRACFLIRFLNSRSDKTFHSWSGID